MVAICRRPLGSRLALAQPTYVYKISRLGHFSSSLTSFTPSPAPSLYLAMDSYVSGAAAPPLSASHGADLAHLREAVSKLEADHKAKGTPLSGRIIHLCHYLPIVSTLQRPPQAPPSPPKTPPQETVQLSTPPTKTADLPLGTSHKWHLSSRRGHTAMHSGIRSLTATHKQVIVAYTGEIHAYKAQVDANAPNVIAGGAAAPGVETIPIDTLSSEEKAGLESAMLSYQDPEVGDQLDISYVPVWIDDKTAKGHYDGYCKNSTRVPRSVLRIF